MTMEEIARFRELNDLIFEEKATEQDHFEYRELKWQYDMWLLEENESCVQVHWLNLVSRRQNGTH